jgi:hypothetical protein
MTDLTEQWQKGELELDKNYYLELEDGTIEIQMYVGGFLYREDNGVKKVLSEVPTYQEYLALQSDSLAKNEGAEIVAELEKRLKKTQGLELDLRRKNHELKELLKECRDEIDDDMNWLGRNELGKLRLIEKIDEVLDDRH